MNGVEWDPAKSIVVFHSVQSHEQPFCLVHGQEMCHSVLVRGTTCAGRRTLRWPLAKPAETLWLQSG